MRLIVIKVNGNVMEEKVEQDEGGLILRVCFLTSFPEILSFFSFLPMSFNPVCVLCECVFTFVMCVEFGTC